MKNRSHNSRAVEEDKLKVMHYNILVCGVLIHVCMASIESVIPGPWVKHKLSLYRHDFKTSQMMMMITASR